MMDGQALPMTTNGDAYFADGEYLLFNSTYSDCKYIVQSFQKVSRESSLTRQKEAFNTALGQVVSNRSIAA